MNKIGKYKIHSLANIFPMITETEFTALKNDISINGLRESIWLYKNEVIDGRNRLRACLELNIKPSFKEYTGNESELFNFVLSLNLHRRHLSTSQRACISIDLMPQIEEQTKKNLSEKMKAIRSGNNEDSAKLQNLNTSQTLSKMFSISERYIFDAKKLKQLNEILFNEVKTGNITLQKALKQIKENEVSAKLQKAHNENKEIEVTKSEIRRAKELSKELGVSEQKALDYIISKRKVKRIKEETKQQSILKFQLNENDKLKLFNIAKERNISLSELLRNLIKESF